MIATAERLEASHEGTAVALRLASTDNSPGKRLKQVRQERGYTQDDVAKHLGLSRAAYCQYETGSSRLRVYMLEEVAPYLSTTPEWLAFGVGSDVGVGEVEFSAGQFIPKRTWSLDPAWLRDYVEVFPHRVRLLQVEEDSPTLHAGDIAIVDTEAEPNAIVDEFVVVYEHQLKIGNVSLPAKSDVIRFHHNRTRHEDMPEASIYGRVVGKISRS